jgi:hypothetical protein
MKYLLQVKGSNGVWLTAVERGSYGECCNWWEVYQTDYVGYAVRIVGVVVISELFQ